jgi:hypothetical protein
LNDHDVQRKADRPATPVLAAIAHKVMLQRGLEPDFSPAVQSELARIDGPAKKSGAHIRDLRALLWCSIDNDDSRDLDQLTVARENGGDANILVAIADVDALVGIGSAIDAHGGANTTSVVDTDPIVDALVRSRSYVARCHLALDLDRRAKRGQRAGEFASRPSPAPFTMRPPCDTIAGSTTSSRIRRTRAYVPLSSRSISRV